MRRIYYIIFTFFQGILILSTIINLIFCIITSSNTIVFTSIYLPFIPYFRFLKSGNIAEVFALLLFLAITITLYIFCVKELFNENNKKHLSQY